MATGVKPSEDPQYISLKVENTEHSFVNLSRDTAFQSEVLKDAATDMGYPETKIIYNVSMNLLVGDQVPANFFITTEDYMNLFRFAGLSLKYPVPVVKEGETKQEKSKLEDWELDFMKTLDMSRLFGLFLTANALHVERALKAAALTVADIVKGKSPEEIRAVFKIPDVNEQPKSVAALLANQPARQQ